jgi:hypothetical protein
MRAMSEVFKSKLVDDDDDDDIVGSSFFITRDAPLLFLYKVYARQVLCKSPTRNSKCQRILFSSFGYET